MKLVFLYGPPAVGKLTIAKELQKALGYKLLYNHMIINIFDDIFPFGNSSRRILTREFRMRIIEEAIKNDINLIITAGTAGSPTLFDYFTELLEFVESEGGHVFMIHFTANSQTLLDRVEDDFRKEHGKNFGKEEMQRLLDTYTILFDKYPNKDHLTVDTKDLSPREVRKQIIAHYKLLKMN